MQKLGMFEDAIESGTTTVKKVAKQTVSDLTKSAKGQVAGNSQANDQASDQGTNEQGASNQMTDDQRVQFLKDLYGKSDKTQAKKQNDDKSGASRAVSQNTTQKVLGISPSDPNKNLTPEELTKLESLRSQLHGSYYEDLINSQKPAEEPVAEKLEREEQEEGWELQKKEKEKPPPLAVANAQKTERNPGVSG